MIIINPSLPLPLQRGEDDWRMTEIKIATAFGLAMTTGTLNKTGRREKIPPACFFIQLKFY
jgi:hypothetical protein